MTSFVRPFVISLLCGMAAIGHAPAWLHVAGCDIESHLQASSEVDAANASDCHHGCCHQPADVQSAESERHTDGDSTHPHGSHDPDTCLICQSLGMPNGFGWQLESPLSNQQLVELAIASGVEPPATALLSIPQPRGPPALTA
jgi:hypothetical protein